MRLQNLFGLRPTVVALVLSICMGGSAAPAQAPEPACSPLLTRIDETAGGWQSVSSDIASSNWLLNARCLMGELSRMDGATLSSSPTLSKLKIIAGSLRAIIEVNPREYRAVLTTASTYTSTRALASASAADDQPLRLNATFVIANIIDPDITCVVVDELLNPDIANRESGKSGRANLLGSLRAMANWADPFTRALIRESLSILTARIANERDVEVTKRLIDDVGARLDTPIRHALERSRRCQGYNPRFARRTFEAVASVVDAVSQIQSTDPSAANGAVAYLTSLRDSDGAAQPQMVVSAVWPLTRNQSAQVMERARQSIRRAHCYQERSEIRNLAGRYLVICHPTLFLCEKTRGPNRREGVKQSPCTLVTPSNSGFVDLQGDGFEAALFRYSEQHISHPYPAVD